MMMIWGSCRFGMMMIWGNWFVKEINQVRQGKMASALSNWLVDPSRNPLAKIHMKTIANRLSNFGLRYDDLLDPMYDMDVKEALNRLPKEVVDARHQRLLRALDLSMKHAYLPEGLKVKFNDISFI